MSGCYVSPGDAFNAEAISIFSAIILVVVVIALLGVVIAVLLAIGAIAMIVASIFFLAKKEYTYAVICFLVGIICLPCAVGLYGVLDEWKKVNSFRQVNNETVTLGHKMYFRLSGGRIIQANSEVDAAMGRSRVITGKEKNNVFVQILKKDVDTIMTCRVNAQKRTLDIYFSRKASDYQTGWPPVIHDYYDTFQKWFGLSRSDPVRVRGYCGRRLVFRTGKLTWRDDSNEYFHRKIYHLQMIIDGKREYDEESVNARKKRH